MVKDIVVLAKMRAFDAVESVWLSIEIVGVSLLRNWLPIWIGPLGYWVAVRVVEPKSRTASARLDCEDDGDGAGSPSEMEERTVESAVSLHPSLSGSD